MPLAMNESFSHCTSWRTFVVGSLFKISTLLRHHLHKIKCTYFKCIDWVFQMYIAMQTPPRSRYKTPWKRSLVPFSSQHTLPSPRQPLRLSFTIVFSCSRLSYKWNHTVCTFMSGFFHFIVLRFNRAVICISSMVFFIAEYDSIVWTDYNSLTHSSVHGQLALS